MVILLIVNRHRTSRALYSLSHTIISAHTAGWPLFKKEMIYSTVRVCTALCWLITFSPQETHNITERDLQLLPLKPAISTVVPSLVPLLFSHSGWLW